MSKGPPMIFDIERLSVSGLAAAGLAVLTRRATTAQQAQSRRA
jgi:hypothetical protein